MTTAVAQVLTGTERVLTDSFRRFMLHYRFQADFCNPNSGNEKGNVENKVGYSRRNALVPVPTITSFDSFNETLWDWCEKDANRPHYMKGDTSEASGRKKSQCFWFSQKPRMMCSGMNS